MNLRQIVNEAACIFNLLNDPVKGMNSSLQNITDRESHPACNGGFGEYALSSHSCVHTYTEKKEKELR